MNSYALFKQKFLLYLTNSILKICADCMLLLSDMCP